MANIDKSYNLTSRLYHEDNDRTDYGLLSQNGEFNIKTLIEKDSYIQLDYIMSTGSQYINTEYYWKTKNTKVIADVSVENNTSYQSLWGSEEYYNNSGRYFGGIPHGKSYSFGYYLGTGSVTTISFPQSTRVLLEVETTSDLKYNVKRNGTAVITNGSFNTTNITRANAVKVGETTGYIFIFANHNSGTNGETSNPTQQISSMKLYGFKLYDNGVIVRDFIPVKENSTNKIGLLDLVEGKFYVSPNGVAFTAGNVLTPPTIFSNKFKTFNNGSLLAREFIEY